MNKSDVEVEDILLTTFAWKPCNALRFSGFIWSAAIPLSLIQKSEESRQKMHHTYCLTVLHVIYILGRERPLPTEYLEQFYIVYIIQFANVLHSFRRRQFYGNLPVVVNIQIAVCSNLSKWNLQGGTSMGLRFDVCIIRRNTRSEGRLLKTLQGV